MAGSAWARLQGLALSNLLAVALLLAYAVLLGTPVLDLPARALGNASFLDVRSVAGVLAVAKGVLVRVVLQAIRYAPLGMLAVLALPDREGGLVRLFRIALPATAIALALAAVALGARGAWTAPGPFELVLPTVGVLLGVGV